MPPCLSEMVFRHDLFRNGMAALQVAAALTVGLIFGSTHRWGRTSFQMPSLPTVLLDFLR